MQINYHRILSGKLTSIWCKEKLKRFPRVIRMNSSNGKKEGICLKFCNNIIECRPLKCVTDDELKEPEVRTSKPLV